MGFRFSSVIKTAIVAGALGLAGLAATTTTASAHYMTTRCDDDGDHCWVVRCDDDCDRVREYDRSDEWRYYHPRGYWACDDDGDRCNWVYEGYRARPYYVRPSVGVTFGWHN